MLPLLWMIHAFADDTACPTGTERGEDTEGNCCWPGQVWNGAACAGPPSECPEALRLGPEDCLRLACPSALTWVAPGVCCLTGQSWDVTQGACIGTPQCPPGSLLIPGTTTCRSPDGGVVGGLAGAVIPAPPLLGAGSGRFTMIPLGEPTGVEGGTCPAGQHPSGNNAHCCWQGQGWSTTATACVGPPTCPSETWRHDGGCATDARPDEPAVRVLWSDVHVLTKIPPKRPKNPVWPPGESVLCVVRFKVDRAGVPTSVTPLTCPKDFVAATLEAAQAWRFSPHLDDEGKPVAFQLDQGFQYPHP